ncbi:MAG: hypothetical protein WA805_14905, partial [Trebonia sp.]|uniref:hypothetical protein n=1 Tax=Trebonia sp. TaxID=2767075 RepID=UPI003CA2441A
QSWSASHTQWAAGKMNGFVTSTEQAAPEGDKTAAMVYWTDQDLPFTTDWPGRFRWPTAGSARVSGRRSLTAGSCWPGRPTA